jgi:predicted anti-sigma-YlaC factor YlaD
MNGNCTFTEERLSDYLDRQLLPEEDAALSAHVAGCDRCKQLVTSVSGLVDRMQHLEMVEEPPQLVAKILEATLGSRAEKKGWKRWFAWFPALLQPRFAMGAVTVVASFVIVIHSTGLSTAKIRRAEISPISMVRSANRQVHLAYARSAKFVNDLRVVYEIQSRLQPEPTPAHEPAAEPLPGRPSQPSSSNPQQKSQTNPRPSRNAARNGTLLAFEMPDAFSYGATENFSRSSR